MDVASARNSLRIDVDAGRRRSSMGGRHPKESIDPPNWDGTAKLLIHLRPGGSFSTWLTEQAGPGARLTVRGPQGAFGLRDHGIRPRWFVAGGMGLAPMLSMMRRMAEWADPQLAQALTANGHSPDVYVCGPPAMVDAAAEVARCNGVDDEHLILERYLPTGT
jgi:ferredoxin-NADP reductase